MNDKDAAAREVRDGIEEIERQEAELVLGSFTLATAWEIGSSIVHQAQARGLGAVVDIRRPSQVLFHAALPGATADNDRWVERKTATVFRFEVSTLLLQRRFAEAGISPSDHGWLDPAVHTLAGGAFPVVVAGAGLVAVATVSGLTDLEDHMLVVEALRAHLAGQVRR
ncbi:heme-degrading domain-containing protein [Cellulomonas sp. KRMCY2]|uniref:heme-degrading domain-containing protein n=1 Tax=Cellulomonas sp. KRMCY2 TaxID=1304865 RepID=UPI00045E91D6|nr:heme-degrading domain-containing protein [Cellulomonas sp. KRMCY2]